MDQVGIFRRDGREVNMGKQKRGRIGLSVLNQWRRGVALTPTLSSFRGRTGEGTFGFPFYYLPVSRPTISGAKSWAICWTSGIVRGGQRAGQHHYADSGHSQGGGPGMGGPGEGAGYDANRRHALGLGHHCVVETPRCAGPSIRDGVDHHVAIFGKGLDGLIGAGGAVGKFGGVHDLSGAVFVKQDLF